MVGIIHVLFCFSGCFINYTGDAIFIDDEIQICTYVLIFYILDTGAFARILFI